MERRAFLGRCAAASLAPLLPGAARAEPAAAPAFVIADAHAHPYQMYGSRAWDSSTPTLPLLQEAGVALSAFSAVGDAAFHRSRSGMPFSDTQAQFAETLARNEKGELDFLLKAADVDALRPAPARCTALLAIEGGDALEGRLKNLDAFYGQGVRLLTLLHDRDNDIGYHQRSASDGPLSAFGVALVERMNALGIVVDVAHAKSETLAGIAEVSASPLIDSHTSLRPAGGRAPRRLRSWQDMERVARSGGVMCTWPFAYVEKEAARTTLAHWADEIVAMKARIGIEHCALGTDGGGGLPAFVAGWRSIASLPALFAALRVAGLREDEIAAFAGGNFLRVLRSALR